MCGQLLAELIRCQCNWFLLGSQHKQSRGFSDQFKCFNFGTFLFKRSGTPQQLHQHIPFHRSRIIKQNLRIGFLGLTQQFQDARVFEQSGCLVLIDAWMLLSPG